MNETNETTQAAETTEVPATENTAPVEEPKTEPVEVAPVITAPNIKVKKSKKKVAAAAAPVETTSIPDSEFHESQTPETPVAVQNDAALPENKEPTDNVAPAAPVEPYLLFGQKPNGGPGSEKIIAVEVPDGTDNMFLLGVAAGLLNCFEAESPINPKSFHSAIRSYRPAPNFKNITVMDEKMYVCRVAHRLMTQAMGKKIIVDGAYSSGQRTEERLTALKAKIAELVAPKVEDASTQTV